MKILLIEDEPTIATMLQKGLEDAHFIVDWAKSGDVGYQMTTSSTYHLVLLDLMLPGMDGWSICQRLRARRDTTPLLMLTARDSLSDRVRGLEIGADDYLAKPFEFPELLARVRALLRRDKIHKSRIIRVADLEIDTDKRQVTRADKVIVLTPREYLLLEALAANEGRILTRDVIQGRVWMEEETHSNTVNVYVGLLRKKIDDGFVVKLIQTVHGVGYRLSSGPNEGTP